MRSARTSWSHDRARALPALPPPATGNATLYPVRALQEYAAWYMAEVGYERRAAWLHVSEAVVGGAGCFVYGYWQMGEVRPRVLFRTIG